MLDKKLILELHRKNHKMTEIATIMGVSRQRIHQIVKDYRTITKSKKHITLLSNGCKICFERASHIHHIDRNSRNNTPKNLLPVCRRCHYSLHVGIKHDTVRQIVRHICLYCGKRFSKFLGYNSNKSLYCSVSCALLDRKKGKWSVKWSECISCNSTLTPYQAKGMCRNCYQRYNYLINKQKNEEFK